MILTPMAGISQPINWHVDMFDGDDTAVGNASLRSNAPWRNLKMTSH
jgi:hypothetical protein